MTYSTKPKLKHLIRIMHINATMIFSILLFLTAIQFGCTSKQSSENLNVQQKPLAVFLVRHAEKADLTENPELSEIGNDRALKLAEILRSANIEYIHSSDFIRTRETAAPAAKEFRLTTEIYDPGDLEGLVRKLKDKGGNHLVVGHSNTTPSMVSLLGSNPGSEINELSEFDRLYIVMDFGNGNVNSILMRYGHPYDENNSKAELE